MEKQKNDDIDWGAYATQYDLMCTHNDSYDENITQLLSYIKTLDLPENCNIADIGAGTGNFICKLGSVLPVAHFTHIDANREMNQIALEKYSRSGLENVQIIESDLRQLSLNNPEFDLIICINALYAMPPQELILTKFRHWLSPTGKLYVIDLGRKMNSVDWGLHFLQQSIKQKRLLDYLRSFLKGREVIRQNQNVTVAQESGQYWMHDTETFGEKLESAGFKVETLEQCYRGYADLAICSVDPQLNHM